ncbi:MAG: hypothetical protein K6B43_09975 [Treponema sp.]|nr:hypothetical protein [Treponema sp.]
MRKLHLPKQFFTVAWCVFHFGILAAFMITLLFYKKVTFDGNLNSMYPENSMNKAAKIADANITNTGVKNNYILVGSKDFSKAKETAKLVTEELKKYPVQFEKLVLEIDENSSEELEEFVHEWRYNILSDDTIAEISSDAGTFATNALSELYSGFSLSSLSHIDEDPFLLDSKNLKHCMQSLMDSGTSMRPKDGVMATNYEGIWYVMIQAVVTDAGASMSKTNASPVIYKVCAPYETDEVKFAFNGVNFHSQDSSSSALRETSWIGLMSTFVIVILILSIFNSLKPLVCSLFSIFVSMFIAFCMTHAIFGNMHVITLLFGTSLIGSSIDYSVHYFVCWKHNKRLNTPQKIRMHLFKGLILSLLSTEICYAFLCTAPFVMLKQMAVFSLVGIMSSFLTATGIFTLIKIPVEEKRRIKILDKLKFRGHHKKTLSRVVITSIFVFCAVALGINHDKVRIENNLNSLYTPKGRLKGDLELTVKVLNFNRTSWFIISGNTVEETLQLEEKVAKRVPGTFICTSKFIPSMERQKKSLEASKKLIPLSATQVALTLGLDDEEITDDLTADFASSISKKENEFLTPDSELPDSIKSILNTIWIGKVEDKYYSLIVPSRIEDESVFREIEADFKAQGYGNDVYFEVRAKDLSAGLDKLTKMILEMFGLAYCIIFIILKFFYNWRDTLKIALIPLMSVLSICTTFILSGQKIEFFCVTGMILVFGLGLDYIIYKMENKESKAEAFAIAVSFMTTAISFGALILSTFVPVHRLGLSIFSGLVTAFICTIL